MKSLEPIITIGGIDVAAIVETTSMPKKDQPSPRWPRTPGAFASKRPVAVILRIEDGIRAFSSDGVALSMDEFDAAFPGLRTQFERRCCH